MLTEALTSDTLSLSEREDSSVWNPSLVKVHHSGGGMDSSSLANRGHVCTSVILADHPTHSLLVNKNAPQKHSTAHGLM